MIPALDRLSGLLEELALALPEQRWFGDKGRRVTGVLPLAVVWLLPLPRPLALVLLEVQFASGGSSRYHLALALEPDDHEETAAPPLWSGLEEGTLQGWRAREALGEPQTLRAILEAGSKGAVSVDEGARLVLEVADGPPSVSPHEPIRPLGVEQSNTNLVIGDRLLVKLFRRAWPGPNPEVEMVGALTQAGFPAIAPVRGWIEIQSGPVTSNLALIQRYLPNGTDGFALALTSLRDLEGDLLADADGEVPPPEVCRRAVLEQGGSFLPAARELGQLTAAMHLSLASAASGLTSGGAPLEQAELAEIAAEAGRHLEGLLRVQEQRLEPLRVRAESARAVFGGMAQLQDGGRKIRVHGDLHLGQLLRTDDGWHFLDFEGRPSRASEERRRPASPLQDVAGMLRSFDYAAAVALRQQVHPDETNARTLEPYGRAWAEVMRDAFWVAYRSRPGIKALLPARAEDADRLRWALELAQALYEVDYELNARPDWVEIPLEGIARLVGGPSW